MENKLEIAFLNNIKLLGKKFPHPIEIKQFLNKKCNLNEAISTHIIYYMLSTINLNKALELLPWPLPCSKTRAKYRIGVKKFIMWINKEWPEAQIKFVSSLLTNPVNERKRLRFHLKLSLFTLKICARKDDLELGYRIPELLTPDCESSEKLLIYQNKAISFLCSFKNEKRKLHEQVKKEKKEIRKFKKCNDLLKNCLGDETNNLISLCPVKFQTRLVSNDHWKSVIIEWTQEIDELSEIHESKLKVVEALFNSYCDLNNIKICNNSDYILDAEEILSVCNKNVFEHYAAENKISLFKNRKLSLPGLLEVCKIGTSDIFCFLENKPPLNNNLNTTPDDISKDLKELNKSYIDHYTELCNLESKLRQKCSDLVQELVNESQEPLLSRKLSNFFESPLLLILQDSITESPEFTSPGISGEQLLEETKRKFEKLSLHESENDSAKNDRGTPISRKEYSLLSERKNKNFNSKIEKGKLSTLAVSLLQKQIWGDNNLSSINSNDTSRKEVLSSTMRSESSKKNLRIPIESAVDESLSPISGNSALRRNANIVGIEKKNLNLDGGSFESSVDTFFSPLMSGRHSLSIKNTKLLTSDLEKKTTRRSLESSLQKILSPSGGTVLKTIKDEPLIIDSDEDSDSSLNIFHPPIAILDPIETKIKPRPSIQIIIDKYKNLRKKMEDGDL